MRSWQTLGKQVTRFKPGDLVVVDPSVSCGTCDQCRIGHFHTCRKVRFLGCPGQLEGCLCDFIVMPEDCCYSAKGLTADQAALVEPLSIGHYAVQLSGDLKGKKIGILGSGPIGLSVLLAARIAGASAIYVTDRLDYRLEAARQQGATWTGNPDRTDIVLDIIQREPLELDVVFECCGQQTAFDQAMKLCKPMGRIVIVGIPETDQSSFPVHDARRKGLTFINVRRQNECVDPVINLIREGSDQARFYDHAQIQPGPGGQGFRTAGRLSRRHHQGHGGYGVASQSKGVKVLFPEIEGSHVWNLWRNNLNETAPMLFTDLRGKK